MGVEFKQQHNLFTFACPIHGGDNSTGACIYSHDKPNWKCWTHECHNKHGSSLYSFVRAYLNRNGKNVSKNEVIEFLNSGNINIESCVIDSYATNFINTINIFNPQPEPETPVRYKPKLTVPSRYFLNRGFSANVLRKYYVGDCNDEKCPLDKRAVVPVYNKDNELRGYTARTLIDDRQKWKNSWGFVKTNHLYNLNFAKKVITQSRRAIIVEGPANSWRFYEAGVYNSVGIFGAHMSEYQMLLLEQLGVDDLIIMTDMDDAGRKAAQSIIDRAGKTFNITVPEYDTLDPAEMQATKLKLFMKDFVK